LDKEDSIIIENIKKSRDYFFLCLLGAHQRNPWFAALKNLKYIIVSQIGVISRPTMDIIRHSLISESLFLLAKNGYSFWKKAKDMP